MIIGVGNCKFSYMSWIGTGDPRGFGGRWGFGKIIRWIHFVGPAERVSPMLKYVHFTFACLSYLLR